MPGNACVRLQASPGQCVNKDKVGTSAGVRISDLVCSRDNISRRSGSGFRAPALLLKIYGLRKCLLLEFPRPLASPTWCLSRYCFLPLPVLCLPLATASKGQRWPQPPGVTCRLKQEQSRSSTRPADNALFLASPWGSRSLGCFSWRA